MHTDDNDIHNFRLVPGNALVMDSRKTFRALANLLVNNFLTKFEGVEAQSLKNFIGYFTRNIN